MAFDPKLPPDPAEDAGDAESAAEMPDALDHVIEVADMMTICAAQRLVQIDVVRREALADAARHGREFTNVIERSVRLEIAAALRITEHAAGDLLVMAEALVERYPAVLASFSGARMTERHAELLVDALDTVEPEFRESILSHAITLAESQSVGTFRRGLRKLVETVRSVTLEERHEQALRGRRIVIEPASDGMAWVLAYVPAVEAHAIHGRATAIAKVLAAQEGETRTLDQLRADVLCDLLIEGDTSAHPAEARGIRASVVVTVPALSLLNDDGVAGGDPATVEGIGPIPMSRARELCGGDGGWMRVLTHPETGMVLSVGRDQYRPPPSLRRLVKWRADRCMAPGCGVPASRCQIDHQLAWEHHGPTCMQNLCPFCQGHHTVKHHGGWTVRQIPGSGGTIEWTSPTGRQYIVHPERRVPVFRPQAPDDPPPF